MVAAIIPSASRSTSSSRKSTSTKPPRSGAWTLRSARPRRPTTKRARFSSLSTFPSGSEAVASNAEQEEQEMAKKSMIEKNEMRRRLAKKYAGKRERLGQAPASARDREEQEIAD